MKAGILNIDEVVIEQNALIPSVVSFKKYISFLERKIAEERGIKSTLYRFILRRFERHPELMQDEVDIAKLSRFTDILELVQDTVSPLVNDDNKTLFALSVPLSPQLFYCTDALYAIAFDSSTSAFKQSADRLSNEARATRRLEIIYRFILERLYHFNHLDDHELIYTNRNDAGLINYYRLDLDTRFVDILYEGELPEINFERFAETSDLSTNLELLQQIIPLSRFKLRGFSIVNITDVTTSQAIENLKNSILNMGGTSEENYYTHISTAIKTLLKNNSLEVGLLPFLKVNDQFVVDEQNNFSILVKITGPCGALQSSYNSLAGKYMQHPKSLLVPSINTEALARYPFLQHLKNAGINSYFIIPISYNDKLVGILELASPQKRALNEKQASPLMNAIPLIAQILKHRIDEFNAAIEGVIKEKFTSLQPSVEWRFNEVAWEYIKNNRGNHNKEISTVYFKDVYPLYGAIDIRNSSVERNRALQQDLAAHFSILAHTLQQLKEKVNIGLIDEMLFKCNKWEIKTADDLTTDEEIRLSSFFDNDVKPFLDYFKANYTDAAPVIDAYYREIDPEKGMAFSHRRKLENAIQLINTTVSNFLEKQRIQLQKAYPNYFEKFRTDGIEYDIYIGQSISPQKPFNELYIRNLRLWQLASMAEIARLTHALLPQMETPLQTTQLILAHTSTIDISFRNDERRFDVEGAYNIRYEVVKKRIDKVHIRHTEQRLTQTGTIALVYYNNDDAREYLKYIQYLQENKILEEGVEYLELEDLQGVSGLKAIRVKVALD
jgi:GAF domain-containing protein